MADPVTDTPEDKLTPREELHREAMWALIAHGVDDAYTEARRLVDACPPEMLAGEIVFRHWRDGTLYTAPIGNVSIPATYDWGKSMRYMAVELRCLADRIDPAVDEAADDDAPAMIEDSDLGKTWGSVRAHLFGSSITIDLPATAGGWVAGPSALPGPGVLIVDESTDDGS